MDTRAISLRNLWLQIAVQLNRLQTTLHIQSMKKIFSASRFHACWMSMTKSGQTSLQITTLDRKPV
jgi:hypothetical protein